VHHCVRKEKEGNDITGKKKMDNRRFRVQGLAPEKGRGLGAVNSEGKEVETGGGGVPSSKIKPVSLILFSQSDWKGKESVVMGSSTPEGKKGKEKNLRGQFGVSPASLAPERKEKKES